MAWLTIGFSSHSGIFSSTIRLVTASKVSHTYIRIPNFYDNEDMVFQASGLSVNYCNYNYFKNKSKVKEEYEIDVSSDQYLAAMKLMSKAAGKPYSYREILGYVYVLAMRQWFDRRVSNPFGDGDKSYVCSELAAECLGIKDAESMTPEDLRRWCVKNGRLIQPTVLLEQ